MNPTLSSSPVYSPWEERVGIPQEPTRDYENGGAALGVQSDSSEFEWELYYEEPNILIRREGVPPVVLFSESGVTRLSLAFDTTMNAHVAYVAAGVSKFRYWDSLNEVYATLVLPGARTPLCCSDEKTPLLSADRDVILTYLRATSLYVRLQRDRYLIEYEKIPDPEGNEPILESTQIIVFGMNTGRRLQWRFV